MKKRQILLMVLFFVLGVSFISAKLPGEREKRVKRAKVYKRNFQKHALTSYKIDGNVLMVNNKECRLYLDIKNSNNQIEKISEIIFNGEKTVFQGKDGYLAKQGYRNENKVIIRLVNGKELNLTLWADANMEMSVSKLFDSNKFDIEDPLKLHFTVNPDKGQKVKFQVFSKNNNNSVLFSKELNKERDLELKPNTFKGNKDLEFRAEMFAHKNSEKTSSFVLNVDFVIVNSIFLRSIN